MVSIACKLISADPEHEVELQEGKLLNVLKCYVSKVDDELYDLIINYKVSIMVNDEVIHPDDWADYVLKEKDRVVVVPTPGKFAKKAMGFLMIAAGIALMVIAPGGITVPLLGIEVSASTTFAMGLSLALSGISNLLFAPDLPSLGSLSSGSRETQTYSWSGIKTTAKVGTPVPVVYGTHMVGGNVISLFTDAYDEDNYLNMLLALCEGEIEGICQEDDHTSVCTTSNQSDSNYKHPAIYLDDQLLRVYKDVQWWYRTGTNDKDATKDEYYPFAQNKIPHFNAARMQYDDGRTLTVSGIEYNTTKPVDAITVQIHVPQLYAMSPTELVERSVFYKVEYKKESDPPSSYTTFQAKKWTPKVTGLTRDDNTTTNSANCICTQFSKKIYKYGDIIDQTYKLKVIENTFHDFSEEEFKRVDYDIKFDVISNNTILDTITISQYMERTVYHGPLISTLGETKHHYTDFNIDDYKIHFTQNVQNGDVFQIEPEQVGTVDEIEIRSKTRTGNWSTLTVDFDTKDTYSIRVSRTTEETDSMEDADKAILQSVTEIVDGYFIYPNTALLGLRIKATDQLSGSPPGVKVLVKGMKVAVPNITDSAVGGNDVAFNDCYWDNSNLKFIKADGSEVYWNDTSIWRSTQSESGLPSNENLVGYWAFDDGSGTVAVDGSGNGNDGTLVNMEDADWVDGVVGKALNFDGTNEYVNCGSDASLRITGDRTLTAWVKLSAGTYPDGTTNWTICENESYQNYGFIWRIGGSTGKQFFRTNQAGASSAQSSDTEIGNNTLRFLCVVISEGTLTFYLDGVADGGGSISAQVSSSQDFKIGNVVQSFNGLIDEVRIYNRALTASEIKTLYLYPDGSSSKEYTNNSMVCIRDLVTAKRYGLGKYLTTSDLYNPEIVTSVKECHKTYNPYPSTELISWWNRGDQDHWRLAESTSTVGASFDESTKVLSITGTASEFESAKIEMDLDTSIQKSAKCDVSITLANLTKSIATFKIYGITKDNTVLLYETFNPTATTISTTITPTVAGISKLLFEFVNDTGLDFEITDVSLQTTIYSHYHTWDGVLESGQSALTVLLEMCDAFRCWPIWYNGKFNFVIDKDDTPIHTISVANMTEFSKSFVPLSEIPYRLTGQFTDEDQGYLLKALIAQSSDDTLIKLNEQTVGLKGIVNRQKAERELIHKLNKATNCTQMIQFKCGLDRIHATAGDIVYVQDDIAQWGQGGRILDYNSTNLTITINDTYTFDDLVSDYIIKYQTSDNDFVTASVNATTAVSQVISIKSWPSKKPKDDAEYAIAKSNELKTFRLLTTNRTKDEEVECSAIEHISNLYDSEPTITVVEQTQDTTLYSPAIIPDPPINVSVAQLDANSGLGFALRANAPHGGYQVYIISVSMSDASDGLFTPIGNIPLTNGELKYINNNLIPEHTYYFRFMCVTPQGKYSSPVDTTGVITNTSIKPQPPDGIRLKDKSPNIHTCDDKDIIIQWNPVGTSYATNITISGYKVEVYHGSISDSNLLRTEFVNSTEYSYTLEHNIDDSPTDVPYSTILFKVYTINSASVESSASNVFSVTNNVPSAPTGLSYNATVGGATFTWDKVTTLDFKNYSYRTKIDTGSWSSWTDISDNSVTRTLTASEISTYGNKPTIYIEVKVKDLYEQESSVSSTSTTANTISDNIFQLTATTDGSGSVSELYDGNKTSGGITIT